MYSTFTELLQERRYDEISVQDIVGRANVGRSTFYAHFMDKDDLLVQSFERVLNILVEDISVETQPEQLINSTALFEHIQSHQVFYRALLRSRSIDLIMQKGQAHIEQIVTERLKARSGSTQSVEIPLPIMAHLVAGSLFLLLQWWLDNKLPYTAQHMDALFQQFVAHGIQAVLG